MSEMSDRCKQHRARVAMMRKVRETELKSKRADVGISLLFVFFALCGGFVLTLMVMWQGK